MSKSIEIKYRWDRDTFLEASRAIYELELRHSPKRFLGWIFIAMTQFGVVGALKKDAFGLLIVATLLVIYWYSLRWPLRRYIINKSFEKQDAKDQDFYIVASSEGVRINKLLLQWSEIVEVVSTKNGFLLFYSGDSLYIPKDAFKNYEEKDSFSHLVKECVASYKREI
jgi:hypothetical protein